MRLHTGVYGHRKRVCAENGLCEKNPFPHRGIESASADFHPGKELYHLQSGTKVWSLHFVFPLISWLLRITEDKISAQVRYKYGEHGSPCLTPRNTLNHCVKCPFCRDTCINVPVKNQFPFFKVRTKMKEIKTFLNKRPPQKKTPLLNAFRSRSSTACLECCCFFVCVYQCIIH